MICNEVRILPNTLNNQRKPKFPSLAGQRVQQTQKKQKRSVSLLIHTNFPGSETGELWYHPHFFTRKTEPRQSSLLRQQINKTTKRMLCPQVPKTPQELSPKLFSPTAQMSSAI